MGLVRKGNYLFQFLAREVINDLYERMYLDCKGLEGYTDKIGEDVFSDGKVHAGLGSAIGDRALLNGNIKVGRNTFISPRATICGDVSIGSNCYIEAGAVVSRNVPDNTYAFGNPCTFGKMAKSFVPEIYDAIKEPHKKPTKDISNFFGVTCKIGANTKFGRQVHIEGGAKMEFGENCKIGNRCIFLSTQHPYGHKEDLIETEQHWHDVKVGNNVVIEDNCIIRGGVTIGDNAVIKAGSVVAKNISAGSVSSGSPAKPDGGRISEVSVKFPHIANVWAVTGHMYPAVAYFNCFGNVSVGREALINNEMMVIGKGTVHIGAKSLVGPRVTLITETPVDKGDIKIDKHCFIGAGAVILPNVTVERGAVVGAGSVVDNDIGKNEIWGGNLAKKIKSRAY
ncbi:MAG: DapH/DapD/GlmU-related protein [Candidatus Diapherotrites archaeon]